MKKMIGIILMVLMLFSFAACGNNDENNGIMELKMDEAQTLVTEIGALYVENGLLEGDHAATMQPILDQLNADLASLQTSHQEILDGGGYDEEDLKFVGDAIDSVIEIYKQEKQAQIDLGVALAEEKEVLALIDKYNAIVTVVNEILEVALENGWYADEAVNAELDAVLVSLNELGANFENRELVVGELKNELSNTINEMLPYWENKLVEVSQPYTNK